MFNTLEAIRLLANNNLTQDVNKLKTMIKNNIIGNSDSIDTLTVIFPSEINVEQNETKIIKINKGET